MDTSVPPLRFLTRPQLKETKGIIWGNPALLRKEARGEFPKRRYLSTQVPVWWEHEIDEWMRSKMNEPRETPTTAKATVKSLVVRAEKRKKRQAEAIGT